MKFFEGDRVCTVGRAGARCAVVAGMSFPLWCGKVYRATRRKRDGALYWQLVGQFGEGTRAGRRPSAKFRAELQAAAPHPWRDGVTHGTTGGLT